MGCILVFFFWVKKNLHTQYCTRLNWHTPHFNKISLCFYVIIAFSTLVFIYTLKLTLTFYQLHPTNTMQLCTFCVAKTLFDTLVLLIIIIISNGVFLRECFYHMIWRSEELMFLCKYMLTNYSGLAAKHC